VSDSLHDVPTPASPLPEAAPSTEAARHRSARLDGPLSAREVFVTWWPLAASWLLMGCELPLVSAVLARLPSPTLSLASYGGVVFPLALLIESPIVMMLAASTAMARDHHSYRLVQRVMLTAAGTITALHALVAFTPLYDLWVVPAMGVPPDLHEPVRAGLRVMLPWTLSIGYRRFQQGVMIRFGRSWAVGVGTGVRLVANVLVLGVGALTGWAPGWIVGPLAVICGVASEAVFAGIVVRPVLKNLPARDPSLRPLTFAVFLRFYLPLASLPMIGFFAMPLASASMTRMPLALESLAVWPILNGLGFLLRSTGFALNEVVIALLDRPNAVPVLRRFAAQLAIVTSAVIVAMAITPIGRLWFERVSALPPELGALARIGLWLALPWPALSVYQSWYQGTIVHTHRTRAITEAVVLSLTSSGLILGAGIALQRAPGLHVAVAALVLGNAIMVAWMALKARPLLRAMEGTARSPGPSA